MHNMWGKWPRTGEETFLGLLNMRVKYTMILKPVGEILTRATVTLGRYGDTWIGCR